MLDLQRERLLSRASYGARPGERESLAREDPAAWLARALAAPVAASSQRPVVAGPALPGPFAVGARERGDPDRRRAVREAAREAAQRAASVRVVASVHGADPLREVMIDFWANHFSVFARKGPLALLLADYEASVLRPHALGRFETLLVGVARSPAMLVSLDNARSRATRRGGVNENYARELLELHTLGVDGGYTQADVVETARVFTGWTLASRHEPRFAFRARWHEPGTKHVLGERIPEGGVGEGEMLLRRLASHPSTARHLATKLARRFVADVPPRGLVERTARRFLETEGDIARTLEVLLLAPELAEPAHQKVKTPLELFASAVRTSGGETDGGRAALHALHRLGELPWHCRTPAGYPDVASRWIDAGAMLERIELAFALADDRLPGTRLGAAAGSALDFAAPAFQLQ